MITKFIKLIKIALTLPLLILYYVISLARVLWFREGKKVKIGIKPMIFDRTISTNFDRHYVYHVSWATPRVVEFCKSNNVASHVDVGSSLFFVSTVSNFLPTIFVDVRPPSLELDNLTLMNGNICSLPFPSGSVESISCMHVLEHIGLGRYGDDLDLAGDAVAASELTRVTKKGGRLFLVVPMGEPKVHFNAHRVYSYEQIEDLFRGFKVDKFDFIKEKTGGVISYPSKLVIESESYGCAMFEMIKL